MLAKQRQQPAKKVDPIAAALGKMTLSDKEKRQNVSSTVWQAGHGKGLQRQKQQRISLTNFGIRSLCQS